MRSAVRTGPRRARAIARRPHPGSGRVGRRELHPVAAPGRRRACRDLAFEKYALGNGLEVILRDDGRAPIAAVNLRYHVGPANEAGGRTGFAHLSST